MNRFSYVLLTTVASVGAALAAVTPLPLKLLWNVSASVPVGLYLIAPAVSLEVTDLVAVTPLQPLADFLVERGYIARDVPLLKRVMALPEQEVCRAGGAITVDDVPLGEALDRDRSGRDLPVWHGCRRIASGELFLMNPDAPDSLDGRYFGPVATASVIGEATPLYTDEDGNGRFVWRAPTR